MSFLLSFPCLLVLFTLLVVAALCEALTHTMELEYTHCTYTEEYKYFRNIEYVCMGFLTAGVVVRIITCII